MMSRYEYLYLKEKVKKAKAVMLHFELGEVWDDSKLAYVQEGIYPRYEKFMKLSHAERAKLKSQWDMYYKACMRTPIGKLFWEELYPAFRADNRILIKQIVEKMKTMPKGNLTPPSSIDPKELERKMNPYFRIKAEVKGLEETLEDYASVYGKKGEETL